MNCLFNLYVKLKTLVIGSITFNLVKNLNLILNFIYNIVGFILLNIGFKFVFI